MEQRKRRSSQSLLGWLIPILSVLILVVVLNLVNEWHFEMRLLDPEEATIQCKAPYDEQGAESLLVGRLFMKDGFVLPVHQQGKVDPNKIGDYTVTYKTNVLWMKDEKTKLVHVVDTIAPTITLVPDEAEYILPGTEYQDPGFTATDNVDGDLTNYVKSHKDGNVITYTVSDSAGNEAVVTRTINVDDPIAPVLTLAGETNYELPAGTVFEEPGYTATDNVDGDLTARVTVTGEVNSFKIGSYELTYDVEDAYHNHATATRTVVVNAVRQPDEVNPGDKVVYLTFDDGPGQYTEDLLAVLDKYNVKVTFFTCDTGYEDVIKKEAEAGHAVAVHSASHDYDKIYASEEAFFADLQKQNDIIKNATGSYSNLLRFPGGSSNTVSNFNPGIMSRLTKAVNDAGFQYFDWNVSSGDAGETTDTERVYQNIIGGIQANSPGYSIVLQHDIKGFSVAAVEKVILWGLENGYTFLPLDLNSPAAHHGVNN